MATPVVISGIKCYAPELAYENEGFPSNAFDNLVKLEEISFWFRARKIIIQNILNNYIGKNKNYKFLEIGCGNGYILEDLIDYQYQLVGSDIFINALINARKRLPDTVELIQMDALNIPFENTFDIIGAFDVIEHIDDDEKVIQEVFKALKPNGYFLITIPQYKWLWCYLMIMLNTKGDIPKKRFNKN